MDALSDSELVRLTTLQELFPKVDLGDLLEVARPHLKSESSFHQFLDGLISQKKEIVKTESDEEEEQLMENLKSSFQRHLDLDAPSNDILLHNKTNLNRDDRINGNSGSADKYVEKNYKELEELMYGPPSQIKSEVQKKEKGDSDSESDTASFHSLEEDNVEEGNKRTLDIKPVNTLVESKKSVKIIPPEKLNEKTAQEKESCSEKITDEELRLEKKEAKELGNDFSYFNNLIKTRKIEKPDLKRKEESKKPLECKKINRTMEEAKETESDVGTMIDHFLKQGNYSKKGSSPEDTVNSYVKKGAIPKRMGVTNESARRSESDFEDIANLRLEKNLSEKEVSGPLEFVVKNRGEEEVGKVEVSVSDSIYEKKGISPRVKEKLPLPKGPFFYVVPENPSPEFYLPKGIYTVTNWKDSDEDVELLKSFSPVVCHPEEKMKIEASGLKGSGRSGLDFPPPKPKESPEEKKTNFCLSRFQPASASDFRENGPIKINRSEVKAKIFCNTPLQSLKKDGEDENDSTDAYGLILQSVANDFGSVDKSGRRKKNPEPQRKSSGSPSKSKLPSEKTKPFVRFPEDDQSFEMKNFQPDPEPEHERESKNNLSILEVLKMLKNVKPEELAEALKNEEVAGKFGKDIVEEETRRRARALAEQRIFEETYSRALLQLPNIDPEFLYVKLKELNGDERAIDSFIQEELVKMQLKDIKKKLSANFPNFDKDFLDKKAKDFLCDPDGLTAFIQEEKRKLKIDEQYELMANNLPGVDLVVLRRIAEDLGGNPELVREFIQEKKLELQKEEEKTKQIIYMQHILPDADPDFLQNKFEELSGDPDGFNAFLYNLLDSKDYPKIQMDDPAVRERNELWRRFVENFEVKDFLKKVPNPEETYSGSKNNNNKTDIGLILKFLQSRYPNLDVTDLEKIFRDQKCNLANTCAQLDFQQRPIEIMDASFRSENISESFLLEIVFILRRREIRDYLREEKALRELKLEQAKKEKALLECRCCFDEELLDTEVTTCPEGHIFCIDCITRSVETQLADGVAKFQCLAENCGTEFSLVTLEKVLEPSLYRKVLRKRQSAEVTEARVPGLESCPSCYYAYIPSPLDKIFKCQNQDCLRETCRMCKEESHVPLRCEEVERPKDTKIRTEIEEKMTEALVRTCPKCWKKFVKTDGCNKMTCPCGAVMCYLCRKLVDSYAHFNGQGGDNFHLCPLWSTNEDLHVNKVKEVGVRARDEALLKNPDIHLVHDPTKTM